MIVSDAVLANCDLYAVPGAHGCIDVIMPDGLTLYARETIEQVRERYPMAQRYTWATWQAEQIARQRTPIIWNSVTAEQYRYGLEVLPPLDWHAGAFLVSEPCDHCAETGKPRYQAYRYVGGEYFAASRPMTRAELKTAVGR